MKPVFVTAYTFEWIEPFNHVIEGDSMTIPDDAYSIEELFNRLDHGLSLGSPAPTFYEDEFESMEDYASSEDPEPDPFYDPSFRKIDRLTYVNDILNDDESNKKKYGKSKETNTRRGHSKASSKSVSDPGDDSGREDNLGDKES